MKSLVAAVVLAVVVIVAVIVAFPRGEQRVVQTRVVTVERAKPRPAVVAGTGLVFVAGATRTDTHAHFTIARGGEAS